MATMMNLPCTVRVFMNSLRGIPSDTSAVHYTSINNKKIVRVTRKKRTNNDQVKLPYVLRLEPFLLGDDDVSRTQFHCIGLISKKG